MRLVRQLRTRGTTFGLTDGRLPAAKEITVAKSDDHSAGDSREPYSDQGGVEGRHAQTHDVAREAATNSTPHVEEPDEFANDLANDR